MKSRFFWHSCAILILCATAAAQQIEVVTTGGKKTVTPGGRIASISATGVVVLKHVEEREIFVQQVDGTGATIDPTPTSVTYGSVIFSGSTDEATNFALYRFVVPFDFDATTALQAMIRFRLNAADTGKHAYKIAMADVAGSAGADSPTFINSIALTFAGDASGASGDEELVGYTTLTAWAAALTAGHTIVVRISRDGDDGTNDTSTVSSSLRNAYLKIGHSQ